MRASVHAYVLVCMHVCVCACGHIFVCVCACMYVCIFMFVCVRACVYGEKKNATELYAMLPCKITIYVDDIVP